MSRENHYTAITLKKQPFGEGDEIITFFSKEQGKIRALAKSVKLAKSRLQARLQSLFLVRLTLAGGNLPKIIAVEVLETFSQMRENLEAIKIAFYATELVLKFTPDEHKNEQLFNLLLDLLKFLNSQNEKFLNFALALFKIKILDSLGLNIIGLKQLDSKEIFFSSSSGGFVSQKTGDALAVRLGTFDVFLALKEIEFENLPSLKELPDLLELQNLLSQFVEYQLERKVKSEKYLRQE